MKFLLDEDLNPEVAEIARGLGLDVFSVHEIDRRGLDDREQLELSASDERIFVTRNRDDFIQLTLEFYQLGSPHCGVLIAPYSLPNNQPKRIAHALEAWYRRQERYDPPNSYLIDFLGS